MRVYLDTNVLAFLLLGNGQLSEDTQAILDDYDNVLMSSVICVDELIHLCQIGKIPISKKSPIKSPSDITEWLDVNGIQIVGVGKKHLDEVSCLHLYEDHRDPNDRLIIAQAISDRIPLVSSDRKFERYKKFGLDFIFNER
jgi:PIN domain nuclease of toxin-antitoxin system